MFVVFCVEVWLKVCVCENVENVNSYLKYIGLLRVKMEWILFFFVLKIV